MEKKSRKELADDAPWRNQEIDEASKKVTNQKGSGNSATLARDKRSKRSNDDVIAFDPKDPWNSYKRNFQFLQQVFTIETLMKPVPPAIVENVSRSLTSFKDNLTQLFDPESNSLSQKSRGIGK